MSFRRWLILGALFAALVLVGGVTIIKKLETGRWQRPTAGDFVQIAKGRTRAASKTIFLERRPTTISPGIDDAARGVSSLLRKPAKLPGWKRSDAQWSQLVACVRDAFGSLDVVVTDERPLHRDYVLVVVGGEPRDIGMPGKRLGGVAPYTGDVIPTPVVFAFQQDVRAVCETVAKEVAHTYGRDGVRQLVSVLGSRS
jgi:hypothetical protein